MTTKKTRLLAEWRSKCAKCITDPASEATTIIQAPSNQPLKFGILAQSVAMPDKEIAFFSFLRELKCVSKKGWLAAILIIVIQLFFTFTKLEAVPFFLYGMYSEKAISADTFTLTSILINGQPLKLLSTGREQDLLETNVENYEAMKANELTDPVKTRIESKYPFFYRSLFYPWLSKGIYNTKASAEKFPAWFKRECLHLAQLDSGHVTITRTSFYLDRNNISFRKIKYEVLEEF